MALLAALPGEWDGATLRVAALRGSCERESPPGEVTAAAARSPPGTGYHGQGLSKPEMCGGGVGGREDSVSLGPYPCLPGPGGK